MRAYQAIGGRKDEQLDQIHMTMYREPLAHYSPIKRADIEFVCFARFNLTGVFKVDQLLGFNHTTGQNARDKNGFPGSDFLHHTVPNPQLGDKIEMSINNRSGKHSFGTIRPRLTILQNRYYFRDIPEGQIAGPNAPYPNTRSIGLRVWSLSLYI